MVQRSPCLEIWKRTKNLSICEAQVCHLQLDRRSYDQFSSNPGNPSLFQEIIVALAACVAVIAFHLVGVCLHKDWLYRKQQIWRFANEFSVKLETVVFFLQN